MLREPNNNGRVLVTGGGGFIGAAVVQRLVTAGVDVAVVDCGSDRRHHEARLANPAVEWIEADLHHVDLVELVSGFDRVVHLAGRPGVQDSWGEGFSRHLADNTLLTQRLLEAAVVTQPERVLLASSSSVYGNIATGLVDERAPLRPLSPYGVSKVAVEMLMSSYVERGVNAAAMRFFTVYGRRQRPDMALSRIISAALGGTAFELRGTGLQARDFTHVDDVASAVVAATVEGLPPGSVLNVGSGRPTRLIDLIAEVERQLGVEVPFAWVPAANGDPQRTAADTSLARELLAWSPSVDLATGVADQVAYHLSRLDGAGRVAA